MIERLTCAAMLPGQGGIGQHESGIDRTSKLLVRDALRDRYGMDDMHPGTLRSRKPFIEPAAMNLNVM